MNLHDLLRKFDAGPDELSESLSGLSKEEWDLAPIEGQWSFREVACHITDFELINAERIRRVLAEDNPTLFDIDPDAMHHSHSKKNRDVDEELRLIRCLRKHLRTILDSCNIEDFQRTGVHTKDGPMTLESLVERTTSHIPHHVEFIRKKREAMNC